MIVENALNRGEEEVDEKPKTKTKNCIFIVVISLVFISVLIGVAVDIEYHNKPAGIYLM